MDPGTTFVVGLIVGAILGVMADRLWERFEYIPRLTFSPSMNVNARDFTTRNLNLDIKNVGRREIQDYTVVIAMDQYGTCDLGGGENEGPLLPSQLRRHKFSIKQLAGVAQFFDCDRPSDWGPTMTARVKASPRPRGMSFRLVLKNGDRVLFSSGIMGEAFAELCVSVAETGKLNDLDWETLRNN